MPKFVLAWITSISEKSQTIQSGGHVVFVRHPERGWEIPGGHLNVGESPEVAWNKEYYPNGWVAHAITNSIPQSESWNIADDKVDEIAWWNSVPPVIKWTEQEFVDLDNWCSSIK